MFKSNQEATTKLYEVYSQSRTQLYTDRKNLKPKQEYVKQFRSQVDLGSFTASLVPFKEESYYEYCLKGQLDMVEFYVKELENFYDYLSVKN